jgi:hypothetical protein
MTTLLAQAKAHGVTPPTERTLYRYGITVNDWIRLLKNQGWVCPICLKGERKWNTDHDHVPQWKDMPDEERKRYVRGVLCWSCNHRRVNSRMSAEEAQRIADYLASYEARRDTSALFKSSPSRQAQASPTQELEIGGASPH